MTYFIFAFNILLMSFGQLLFKKAALFMNGRDIQLIERYILNPWLWGAIMTYGLATILWVHILTNVRLSLAYPIMIGLSYVLTLIGACYFFGESVSILGVFGIGLILVGVMLVTL